MADVRWPLVVAVAVLASGCLGSSSSSTEPAPFASAADVTDAAEAAANETAIGLLLDPWVANATEMELFAGTTQASIQCTAPGGGQVWGGCAYYDWPAGVLVPEGTGALRIEATAGSSLKAGKWATFLDTTYAHYWSLGNKTLEGEATNEPSHTWRIALTPEDWDAPELEQSRFTLSFYGYGDTVNVLDGPIQVKVAAERDPLWTPLPREDAFGDNSTYPSPQEGVVTLLDSNFTMLYPKAGSTTGYPDEVWFARHVPYGSTQVALGITWTDVQGCGSPGACSVRGVLDSGSRSTTIGAALVNERGPNHRILIYDVPEHVGEDSPYLGRSLTRHGPWMDDCTGSGTDGPAGETCSGATGPPNDLRADVRYVAEAWQGEVDLAAFKARLGIA